ncbi:MAG: hypothetical protein LBH72_04775 [Proteiniphilum sp.]|jgi:hypothetical protein|nr:hypothetical protein [Proteiniphilum sp.]
MRKLNSILLLITLSLFLAQCSSRERALNRKLEEMASGLNESAPVQLDRYTRFEEASVMPGNIFRYRYTVLNVSNPDSLVESGLRSMKSNMGKAFSSNPDLRIFRENNVTVEYVYCNADGQIIRSLQITPGDYR